jgi:hypothetical protein
VDESFCLRRLLEVVLALGNYLNGATPRGCAHGFKLDSLLKLSTVKAVDNKRTLIHYLAELVQEEEPELLEIVQELQTVKMASRVSMNQIGADHNELLKGHKGLAAQLKAQEGIVDDDTDKFVAEMRPFAEAADKQLNEITTSRKELEEQFEDVVTSFGDTVTMDHGDKTGTEAFFTIVQTFVDNLIDAHTVNEKVKEAAAKVEKMKVNEEKRKNTMLLKRQVRNIRKNSLLSMGGAGAGGSCKAPLWCVCPAAVALPHLLCPVQQANAIRFLPSCPLALLPVLVDALVCSCCCGGGGVVGSVPAADQVPAAGAQGEEHEPRGQDVRQVRRQARRWLQAVRGRLQVRRRRAVNAEGGQRGSGERAWRAARSARRRRRRRRCGGRRAPCHAEHAHGGNARCHGGRRRHGRVRGPARAGRLCSEEQGQGGAGHRFRRRRGRVQEQQDQDQGVQAHMRAKHTS